MDDELKEPKSGLTRRGFLKGVGGGLAGTAVLSAAALTAPEEATAAGVKALGPGKVPIALKVNGKTMKLEAEPRVTLLSALRDQLDLTGAKLICDRGECGGCTVLLDGKPVYACMMLAVDAQGRDITTVEGLARGDQLDPVQTAFVQHDALMCGFCTPGFVMSVRGLLNRNPNPNLDDVKRACAGNICRCGTYPKVFEAALAAAKLQKGGA
ncbi:MAG: (2Fe-2S)-binding protein [Candidatus Latescibacteria bacterium]|nr:(2Fe-2S)-binding protein [Candidatus Latescibacterota bacterium]